MPQGDFAESLRQSTAAVRLHWSFWSAGKALDAARRAEIAARYQAAPRSVTAGKKLFDTGDPAYRRLTRLKGEAVEYWRANSRPYVEDGVRLVRRDQVDEFNTKLGEYKAQFDELVRALQADYDRLKAAARERLGELYCEADYPADLTAEFAFAWDFPSTEPPEYLMHLNPRLYAEEQARARARFEEAVRLGEQAFAEQLAGLVEHLAERLKPGDDGGKKVFRDTAVTNFREFFGAFRSLDVGSNAELATLVSRAEGLLEGIHPDRLREDATARDRVAAGMQEIAAAAGTLVAPQRRRAWRRNEESPEPATQPEAEPVSSSQEKGTAA